MKKHLLPIVILLGILHAASGIPVPIFTDDFESGTLGNWTVTGTGTMASPLTPDTNRNIIPAGGRFSALMNTSLDRMHHNLLANNGGQEVSGHCRFVSWIYDPGPTAPATRIFNEVRGYSGGSGLPNGGTTASGSLAQLLAAGKYNTVTMPGEVFNSQKYQARVTFPTTLGWFNLNAPGSPNRSAGWHRFEIEVMPDGTTVNFYVDGILSRTITGATAQSWDTVILGPGIGTPPGTIGDAWIDGLQITCIDNPPTITCPSNQTVAATSPNGAVVNYPPPTASDDRSTPVVHCDPPPGPFPVGTTEVICTAIDSAQQTARCTFQVTVRPPIEIDYFDYSLAQLTLAMPEGGTETITLAGPTEVHVDIFEDGSTGDSDGDGLDDAATRMVKLDLRGVGRSGPVRVSLRPGSPTRGMIEETANNTPGKLDTPPFTPTGTSHSFFDIFVDVEVGGQVLHNVQPIHMATIIRHKPPAPGDTYVNPFTQPVELVDANGNPTGIRIIREVHTPNIEKEVDTFNYSLAQIGLRYPNGQVEQITLAGPAQATVCIPPDGTAADTDGDGRDAVPTELTGLNLVGMSSQGPVVVTLDPSQPSRGEIEERVNNTSGKLDIPPFTPTGSADTYFDVRARIQVGPNTFYPSVALHIATVITHKPPRPGETYISAIALPEGTAGCIVPDNGSGTVELPPVGCDYVSPADVHMIIDGLPPGTTIQLGATHHRFFCPTNPSGVCSFPSPIPGVDCSEAGGSLGGEKECAGSTLQLNMTGTGMLAGFNRNISLPASFETHVGPRTPGSPVQSFDTDMYRLFGQITGDPDFDLLRITAGTDFGLPSPGHTTLTQQPGGNWAVDSFFDITYRIDFVGRPGGSLGGMSGSTTGTIRMQAGNPRPPCPVQLLTETGQPTGICLVNESHTPNIEKEIDHFQNSIAQLTLQMPGGGTEVINLSGPTTVEVCIPPTGAAADTDGDGLDQTPTRMTLLNLTGSSSMGPVQVTLDPLRETHGQIEEDGNATPGTLDIPPFRPAGTAHSFFDVWPLIRVGPRVFRPAAPLHLAATIRHKPPAPGDTYVNPFTQPVQLLDENGQATGIFVIREVHTPNPPKEIDRFPNTSALVGLRMPDGSLVNVILSGPATVEVDLTSLGDRQPNGREEVTTELVAMNLSGSGVTLVAGSANGLPPSVGAIEENANIQIGRLDLPGPDAPFCTPPTPANCLNTTADSFFDVFFEVTLPDGTKLYNRVPLRVESTITEKPPRANYRHVITQPIELYDANGNPTGVFLVTANHDTRPKEIDHFTHSSALVGLRMPDGSLVNVILGGPATVAVALDSLQDAPPNGLEEVTTELVSMNLTGSGFQLVAGSANGLPASVGEIEETQNRQVNRLDLPGPDAPFCTPPVPANCAGTTALSHFNVFFVVITPGGQRLHNRVPLRVEAIITEKPPRANYRHVITEPIELYDDNNNPTGVFLVTANHDTRPKEIDRFPNTSALVGLRMPDGSLMNVILNGPATVAVALDSLADAQPNGREEVSTELVTMNLTGSGVTLVAGSAHGLPASVGAIEENANIQLGRLDLPGPDAPFCTPPTPANCLGTTALSFFNVFFEVTLPDGTKLYNRVPLRVESVIDRKPPHANYRHVITEPIELFDAAGRPTGVFLVTANHDTRPKEIDRFEHSSALVGLRMPDGSLVNVILGGPATVAVALDSLQDAPPNGREEVTTELVAMNLTGSGFQLIAGSANGLPASTGEIEENVNVQVNRLDLPGPDAPFCTPPTPANCVGTSATSHFNVFFVVITPGGQRLHNRVPLRVEASITEKPPRANYKHIITQPIELYDENERATGVFLVTANHDTRPKEIDHFQNTGALVGLHMPDGSLRNVILYGPTTVGVALDSLADGEPDGLEEVTTELLAMNLSGGGVTLVAGSVNGLPASMGQIEENQNRQAGRLDLPGPDAPFCTPPVPANCLGTSASSFFDVFFEVTLPDGTRLHNRTPLRVEATITEKPPRANYRHVITQPIELYDAQGRPSDVFLVSANHDTRGPEIDHFEDTTAQVTLCRPDGTEVEEVTLTGPTTVHVFVGMQGQADDSDGDGLDDVGTEMVQMNMTGSSSMGPVTMRLRPVTKHPFQVSGGSIEETANTQTGRLDVPPFAPSGTAVSEFEVYVEIEIQTPNGPIVLHNDRPKRMRAIIDHKPPRPGTIYEFPEIIPLLTENEQPSGFTICRSRHSIGCRINIACPQNITTCNDPGECGAKVDYPAPVVEASCPPVTVVCVPASGSFFNVGTTTVTCTARDSRGNQASCTFNITVRDCEPPRLVCPNDLVVSNDVNACGAKVDYPPAAANDNCPGAVTVSCSPPSGSFFPVGSSTVICSATDAAGNTNRCSFIIVVRDTEPPRIVCPSNIVVRTCDQRVPIGYSPTVSDNCPGVTALCNPPSGTIFPAGTHPVTCHAVDAAGNTSPACTFTVTVITSPAPTLTITLLDGGKVMICWVTDCPGWRLQCTRDLNRPIMWQPVAEPVVTIGNRHCVTLDPQGRHQFYRLCRPEAQEVYAETDSFPPQGTYLSPGDEITVILMPAPGAPPRPILMRWFEYQIPPGVIPRPPPCLTCPPETFQFAGEVMFQASLDGGASWVDVHPEPKFVAIQVVQTQPTLPEMRMFNMEMMRLDGVGSIGMSPFRLRESPTRASVGRTTVRQTSDGNYAIDSFFDVFIELSLDGGETWGAAQTAVPMRLNSRPAEQFSATGTFPPVGTYNSPRKQVTRFENGLLARWYAHPIPPIEIPIPIPIPIPWPDPCLSCPPVDFKFMTDLMFEVSPNGGQTWMDVGGLSDVGVQVVQTRQLGGTGFFDMEMSGLDASGNLGPQGQGPEGILPRWMIRESPTRPSKGMTTVRKASDGTYRLGSFFDIFTEVSLDGGRTWHRSLEPSHVEYIAAPPPQHADSPNLPPAGSYNSPAAQITEFANGIIARWYAHRIPPLECPPFCPRPGPCLSCPPEPWEFDTDIQFQVSMNGGQSWIGVSAPSKVGGMIGPLIKAGNMQAFDVEMMRLDVIGQMPSGAPFMLRESPTRRSQGYTEMHTEPDGSRRVSSFFDIWTDLSVDGGNTWHPSREPTHVVHRASPPQQFEETAAFPPPGVYNGPSDEVIRFDNGMLARWFVHPITPGGCPQCPPPPCLSCPPIPYRFGGDVFLQWSADGGQTWNAASAKSQTAVLVDQTMTAGSDPELERLYATELMQLDISGGTLPNGVRLRESPTRRSLGMTSQRPVSGGQRVGSFFDIWVDLSTDGGQTWSAAHKPSHVILAAKPPPVAERNDLFPPEGSYNSPPAQITRFPNGILARLYRHPIQVPPIIPRPPPCLTCPPEPYDFQTDLLFEFSTNGGQTWQQARAPSMVNVNVGICWIAGGARVYGTEMRRLDAVGTIPGLPPIMIRESPTRRSIGYTSVADSPNLSLPYNVDSFFDIWTELSLDGGNTWAPSTEATHVVLQPQ